MAKGWFTMELSPVSLRDVIYGIDFLRKSNKTRRSTMRPQATFSFFIFLQLFHFFTLHIAPSSSSLLPPRPSFLLVLPSRPLSKSSKSSIWTKALRTDGPTDRRTDKASYRDARTHLKIAE